VGDSDIKSELAAISATLTGMTSLLKQLDTDVRASNAKNQEALTVIAGQTVQLANLEKSIDALWSSLRRFKNLTITSTFTAMASIIAWLITATGLLK
jgi:hypothetical protein